MSILAIDALGTRYELTSSVIDGLFEANEESLVLAAKSGDSQAFVELSTPHTAKLLTRVNQITRNREDAEDVVQEAILRAFLNLDKFEGRSAFATWLTRIAINSALMRLRRKRAEMISLDCDQNRDAEKRPVCEPADGRATPEEWLVTLEREQLLNEAIGQLKPTLRDVVELKRSRSCSNKAIARALGISVPAVKSRLSRARQELRDLLR